jgi:hypothetical protein
LTAAEFLARGQFWLDANYLAGYAPECALKALILAHTPAAERHRVITVPLRGAKAHGLEYLKQLLVRRKVLLPPDLLDPFRRIATWSTELRYEVGAGNAADTVAFLSATRKICDWVERSM